MDFRASWAIQQDSPAAGMVELALLKVELVALILVSCFVLFGSSLYLWLLREGLSEKMNSSCSCLSCYVTALRAIVSLLNAILRRVKCNESCYCEKDIHDIHINTAKWTEVSASPSLVARCIHKTRSCVGEPETCCSQEFIWHIL